MEEFELLLNVLRDLQTAGVLKHCTLVGSWCLEFYRSMYGNPPEIPAVRTLDADLLLERRLKLAAPVDVAAILEKNNFALEIEHSGLYKFVHAKLDIEFLTGLGRDGKAYHNFEELGINAQELPYMEIAHKYQMKAIYSGVELKIPEPEAFALHKLIVCLLRKKPEKETKDIETAKGLFAFFEGKETHVERIRTIYGEFPKGWKKKVGESMGKYRMELPN